LPWQYGFYLIIYYVGDKMTDRQQIALEVLKEVLKRNRKMKLDDDLLSDIVYTTLKITDEFLKNVVENNNG
jgi:hypothetical protein